MDFRLSSHVSPSHQRRLSVASDTTPVRSTTGVMASGSVAAVHETEQL
jgi:hypothetical protein